MKKVFLFLIASIFIFLGLLYGLLFTPIGNSTVASLIQNSVNSKIDGKFEVKDFLLTTSDIKFIATIDDNSQIDIIGKLALLQKRVDLNYEVNIKDLAKLEKYTKQKLNGKFFTKGNIAGDEKLIVVEGISDIFGSNTKYNVKLTDFKPSNIDFFIDKAKIQTLLYTLNQPVFANGDLSINGKIKNANITTLDGIIATVITNGSVNNAIVNQAFNQKLKAPLEFKGDIVTTLQPNQAVSKVDFFTTMANLVIKEATVNLNTMNINSDYLVSITDLSKLYDVTQTKMRGILNIAGNLEKTPTTTKVTGNSKLLDGSLDFELLNDDLKADIKQIDIKKLTYMMYYPEFFTSKADVNLAYNLKEQKGQILGNLVKGQFLPNEYSKLINTFAKFDITREIYEKVDLKSNIDKKIISSTLNMKSNLTSIDVTKSIIDLDKSTIDALIKTELKGIKFNTTVVGDLNAPKVSVDTTELLKMKLKEESERAIKKHSKKLEEKLKEKLGDEAGSHTTKDIIKGFREFFGNGER